MVTIITNGNIPIHNRGSVSRRAWRGPLHCPNCNPEGLKVSRWRMVGKIGPTRVRYQCKDCSATVQYDFSSKPDHLNHPYAPFTKRKFMDVLEGWKLKLKKIPSCWVTPNF